LLICAATAAPSALATDVNVVGLFPGKALVSIDGGQPRTLNAGQQSPEGVRLVSVSGDSATFDINGKQRRLQIGQAFRANRGDDGDTVVLAPDASGHYVTVGAINGKTARFLVDTGATTVALGTNLANQLGIAYRSGRPEKFGTANGTITGYIVRLDSVRIGGLTLTQVDAAVSDGMNKWDGVLLGMSFIGRLSMQRDGQTMRLSRKTAPVPAASDARDKLILTETHNGMFAVNAKVNGIALPFLVDTGATTVSLDAAQARSIGLDYQKGTPGWSNTANGPVRSWRLKLDSIAVGPITLYGIEASVREGPGTGGVGLLGMSFLNRVEMKRDGETLTLTKRF
jgi:aspartyl protease family protein